MFLRKNGLLNLGLLGYLVATTLACPASLVGNLAINQRWVRPSTGPNTAAYFTVTNSSNKVDKLVKVECLHATAVEIHNTIEEDGISKMRPIDFVEIGAQTPVKLQPGGRHVMLMGLKDSFQGKDTIPLTLHFESAGKVEVNFPVTVKETGNSPAPAA